MPHTFTFHHLGVAVTDLEKASAFYTTTVGFHIVSGPIEDPIQKVRACFLAEAGKTPHRHNRHNPSNSLPQCNHHERQQRLARRAIDLG